MAKEYYTKQEVDKLLNDLRFEFGILNQKISDQKNRKKIPFFNDTHHVYDFDLLNYLRELLIEHNLIVDVSNDDFKRAFSGLHNHNPYNGFVESNILDSDDNYPIIDWIGQHNLLPFLIDELSEMGLIERDEINKKTEMIFGIKNPQNLRTNYNKNKNGKPRGSEIIEEIISKLMQIRADEVRGQEEYDKWEEKNLFEEEERIKRGRVRHK